MTGRVKSFLAGAALGLLFILDRAERRKLDRRRTVLAKHRADIAAHNREHVGDRIARAVLS